MTKIVIAQCTNKKRSVTGRVEARELYMASDLFKAQLRYAEAYSDFWHILSAKYGLIAPSAKIYPYDQRIGDEGHRFTEPQQEIMERRVKNWGRDFENVCVELICGEDYAAVLEPYLEMAGVEYSKPFEGQRIGTRKKNMVEAAREKENGSLEAFTDAP